MKQVLKVIWSNNTYLPTAYELGIGSSNKYRDFTYRVVLERIEYVSDKKEDIKNYKSFIKQNLIK